jgi:hypothetical protein
MQPIKYTVLTSIIAFVCIIDCIQEFCYLSIFDQGLSTLSEWKMTWYHIPALSAGNWRHVAHFTIFWQISLNFLTIPYPAPSPRFPWRTTRNFKYPNHVHQICVESYVVGYINVYGMTVVVQIDSSCTLTALPMTCMTSLTSILLAYFVINIAFALWHNSHLQNKIKCDGCLKARFGF